MFSDEDCGPYFDEECADAIVQMRDLLKRGDYKEALIILDRFFGDSGEPK